MLLSISSRPAGYKTFVKRVLHLKCDVCTQEFERTFTTGGANATFHACSPKCQAKSQLKGGILDQKKREVFIERFGVDAPLRTLGCKEKSKQTNIERYGYPVSSQSPEVKEKARQTNLDHFGVEWHTQSENFATKSKKTWQTKYGVDHPMRADEVKAKYDFIGNCQKAHETKKLNGTYASSKCETEFCQRLTSLFKCVETQIPIKHECGTWHVDFKIGNVWIQFDGEYWHGLDRPIDVIRKSTKKRDACIAAAFDRDRLQDVWFATQNLKLVRVTDKQAKKLSDHELACMLGL